MFKTIAKRLKDPAICARFDLALDAPINEKLNVLRYKWQEFWSREEAEQAAQVIAGLFCAATFLYFLTRPGENDIASEEWKLL